jgi:hypothetical protein
LLNRAVLLLLFSGCYKEVYLGSTLTKGKKKPLQIIFCVQIWLYLEKLGSFIF